MGSAPTLNSVIESVRPLLDAGAALHWLVPFQKRPIKDDWSNAPRFTESQMRSSYRQDANIGIRLGEPSKIGDLYLHCIDLDIKIPTQAEMVWAKLSAIWPAARRFPTVISGSGGASLHIYFLTDKPFRKKVIAHSKKEWEIVVMGTGSQCVLPPSIHPDTKMPYRWGRPLDLDLPMIMQIPSALVESWGVDVASDTE